MNARDDHPWRRSGRASRHLSAQGFEAASLALFASFSASARQPRRTPEALVPLALSRLHRLGDPQPRVLASEWRDPPAFRLSWPTPGSAVREPALAR